MKVPKTSIRPYMENHSRPATLLGPRSVILPPRDREPYSTIGRIITQIVERNYRRQPDLKLNPHHSNDQRSRISNKKSQPTKAGPLFHQTLPWKQLTTTGYDKLWNRELASCLRKDLCQRTCSGTSSDILVSSFGWTAEDGINTVNNKWHMMR